MDGPSRLDLEETFDRWEMHLGETEILAGAASPADPLESEFLAGEEAADLRLELDALLDSTRGADS